MSQYVATLERTFTASAAIAKNALVQLANTGKVSTNGLATRPIGIATQAAFADGDEITVRMLYPSYKMIAKEAFAIAATLYTEADGKVQDTPNRLRCQCSLRLKRLPLKTTLSKFCRSILVA